MAGPFIGDFDGLTQEERARIGSGDRCVLKMGAKRIVGVPVNVSIETQMESHPMRSLGANGMSFVASRPRTVATVTLECVSLHATDEDADDAAQKPLRTEELEALVEHAREMSRQLSEAENYPLAFLIERLIQAVEGKSKREAASNLENMTPEAIKALSDMFFQATQHPFGKRVMAATPGDGNQMIPNLWGGTIANAMETVRKSSDAPSGGLPAPEYVMGEFDERW